MNESVNPNKENITIEPLGQEKIGFNLLMEQFDNQNSKSDYKIYYVTKFSENSEEYTHIKKIIPLQITPLKRFIYITLNIISFGIINLFMKWFPVLKIYFRYNVTNLMKASYLGIYGMDGEMNIKKIKKIQFPVIDLEKDSIITNLGLNLKSLKHAIMFDYKSYDYVYNENTDEFEILEYRINCPKKKILQNFAVGLFQNEVEFLKLIFGKCDIDIQITSIRKIFIK